MRRYENKIVPAVPRLVCVECVCDLCGRAAKDGSWAESSIYEVEETEIEVTVRRKTGHAYPSGGMGESYVVDLCPNCFADKLVPWLQSQGAKIKPVEWDY